MNKKTFDTSNIGTFIIKDEEDLNFSKVILGSSSPRRIELLKGLVPNFKIIKPDIDENMVIKDFFKENATGDFLKDSFSCCAKIALEKAKAVYQKDNSGLIISADTIVCYKNQILGKPRDLNQASKTLISLLGDIHYICTGVCLLENHHKYKLYYQVSQVEFVEDGDFVNEFIRKYVQSKSPLDKAGSYNIQEVDRVLVSSIYGDYYNIVGLPLPELIRSLKL